MRPYYGKSTRKPGEMNKTEKAYADVLELRRKAGEILEWAFEPEKLRLADRTFYTPDFRIIRADHVVEFNEVKGFMRDDANVKIKVAAEMHPYVFRLVRWIKKRWEIETV